MSLTVEYDSVSCSNCFVAFFISWVAALTTRSGSSFKLLFHCATNFT